MFDLAGRVFASFLILEMSWLGGGAGAFVIGLAFLMNGEVRRGLLSARMLYCWGLLDRFWCDFSGGVVKAF